MPVRALADLAGLSHMTIYEAIRSDLRGAPGKISELTRAKLLPAITAILEGRLRFCRRKRVWTIEGSILRPPR